MNRNFFITFVSNVWIHGLLFLQGLLLARILGPTGRGEFSAIVLWPRMIAMVSLFGINIVVARSAARNENNQKLFTQSIYLSGITSFLGTVIGTIFLLTLFPQDKQYLVKLSLVFLTFIPLSHLIFNFQGVDQGRGAFRLFNMTRSMMPTIYVMALLALLLFSIDDLAITIYLNLVAALAVIIFRLLVQLFFRKKTVYESLSKESTIDLLRRSPRYGIATSVEFLSQRIDQILILWLLDAKDLGIYVVSLAIATAHGSITSAVGMVTFTSVAKSEQGWLDAITKTFRQTLFLQIVSSLILFLIFPTIIPWLYGIEYKSAVPIALLLLSATFFSGLVSVLDQVLRAMGRPTVSLYGRVLGIIIFTFLAFVLTTNYRLVGVAISFTLFQIVILIYYIYATSSILCIPIKDFFLFKISDFHYFKCTYRLLGRISNKEVYK